MNARIDVSSSYKTKPKVLSKSYASKIENKAKSYGFNHTDLKRKKSVSNNKKGPIKIWVLSC